VLFALAPLIGGIVGTAAMTALLLFPRWLGIAKIDVIPAVGALITGNEEHAFSIGYIVHFASGIIFAYIYWGVLLLMKMPHRMVGVWRGRISPRYCSDAPGMHYDNGASPDRALSRAWADDRPCTALRTHRLRRCGGFDR
jgi:hypothetical protein